MSKISLVEPTNPESQSSLIQAIRTNNERLTAAIDNTLSRDGLTPNAIEADIDFNSNRLINLPAPLTNTEPVRLGDIGGLTGLDLPTISEMAGYADSAKQSAEEAASYVGQAVSAPKWTTGRTITLTGPVTGTSSAWDGSADLSFSTTITAGSITNTHLAAGAVVNNLGYTPANRAGQAFTGDIRLSFIATTLFADSVGFRGIPLNPQNGDHTFTVNDAGCMIRHGSASPHVYYIQNTSVTNYPLGTTIVIRNVGAGQITIARVGGVTLRKAGSATDSNILVSQWGICTLVMEENNVWVASGTGIT